jgi:hypothetical protein
MSDSENYETTFNYFLLHFLRYLCNFCPTCSQAAILMKVSHLGVVTEIRKSACTSEDLSRHKGPCAWFGGSIAMVSCGYYTSIT